jgi:hypothetical protein
MKRFPGRGMSEIRVHCYSGYRADQRPSRCTILDREYNVEEVDDQWCSPGAMYFRVRADDGHYYVLRHDYVDRGIEFYEAKYQQQLQRIRKQAATLHMQLIPLTRVVS